MTGEAILGPLPTGHRLVLHSTDEDGPTGPSVTRRRELEACTPQWRQSVARELVPMDGSGWMTILAWWLSAGIWALERDLMLRLRLEEILVPKYLRMAGVNVSEIEFH